jgi:hypothetical protein
MATIEVIFVISTRNEYMAAIEVKYICYSNNEEYMAMIEAIFII